MTSPERVLSSTRITSLRQVSKLSQSRAAAVAAWFRGIATIDAQLLAGRWVVCLLLLWLAGSPTSLAAVFLDVSTFSSVLYHWMFAVMCPGEPDVTSPVQAGLDFRSRACCAHEFYVFMDLTSTTVDRKSTRLNSSHSGESRMPSSA